ncbi:MAG TPA: MopE-related protein [Sandaracinaceae bacterium LLY-WYZ-13_1]|nr:MopE-related protein [Sandaracinaceae bacterium LLY-WYZ-13_1]
MDEDCDSATVQDDSGVAPDGDVDMDGFIDTAGFNVRPDGSENRGTDCDDSVTEVHPGAREECNGDDDDCDGLVDEGLGRTFWRDEDGDGHGDATMTVEDCVAPMGYADDPDDCDDTTADRSPTNNEATFPCDELDNDCDGDVDEDAGSGLTEWYPDMDEDGYGYADATPVLACSAMWAPADYVDRGGDCQDHDGEVHPGADYHDTPYCEPLLFLDSDTFECAAPGGGACGPASWDYDCSGSVEISTGSPVLGTGIGRCEYDSIGLSCVVTRGFRSMPSADDCGRDTSYVFSCNSSCLARTGSIVPSCR